MASDLATRTTSWALMGSPPRLPMSSALYRAYDDTWRPHHDIGPPKVYSEEVRREAAGLLSMLAPYAEPPESDLIKTWLQPIPFAVRNTKTEEETVGWIHAMLLASAGLPCGAFTAQTQREALHKFKFFPSVSDIIELLREASRDISDKASVLRRIVNS